MATLFKDGFDRYGTIADLAVKGWSITNQGAGSWTYLSGGGVNGGGAINCAQDDQSAIITFRPNSDNVTHVRVFVWFKSGGSPGAEDACIEILDSIKPNNLMFTIDSAGEMHGLKQFITPGNLTTAGDLGVSSGANLHNGSYHSIEIYALDNHDVTSSVVVKIDGVTQINYVGSIRNTNSTLYDVNCYDQVRLYTPDTDGSFDDLHIWDNNAGDGLTGALAAPVVIDTISVDAAGSSTQFTPNTGANYQAVDDAGYMDGDSTYVSDTTVGHKDLYGFAALSISPKTIYDVTLNLVARTEAGMSTQFKSKAKSSSTSDDGPTFTIAHTGYQIHQSHWAVDPNTSAAWTETNLNSAEFGIEMVA